MYGDMVKKMSVSYNQFLRQGIDVKKNHVVMAYIRLLDIKKDEITNGIAQSSEIMPVLRRMMVQILPETCIFITLDVVVLDIEKQGMVILSRSLYEFKNGEYQYLYTSNKIKKKTDEYH